MIPVKKEIPQTGNNTGLYVASIVSLITVIGFVCYIYIRRNKF